MKPASAFLTASAREHAANERPASGPSQSMHVRTLGWHIESSTAEDLFSRLYSAVASIGTMQLSGDSFGSLIFTATVIDGPPAGGQPSSQEPMTALLWVVPSTTGHHVCIRRASGDTFIYHNFYRKVRQATAACQKRVFVSASRLLAMLSTGALPSRQTLPVPGALHARPPRCLGCPGLKYAEGP